MVSMRSFFPFILRREKMEVLKMIVASIETWKKNVYIQSDDDDFLHKVTRRNKISSVQCNSHGKIFATVSVVY